MRTDAQTLCDWKPDIFLRPEENTVGRLVDDHLQGLQETERKTGRAFARRLINPLSLKRERLLNRNIIDYSIERELGRGRLAWEFVVKKIVPTIQDCDHELSDLTTLFSKFQKSKKFKNLGILTKKLEWTPTADKAGKPAYKPHLHSDFSTPKDFAPEEFKTQAANFFPGWEIFVRPIQKPMVGCYRVKANPLAQVLRSRPEDAEAALQMSENHRWLFFYGDAKENKKKCEALGLDLVRARSVKGYFWSLKRPMRGGIKKKPADDFELV